MATKKLVLITSLLISFQAFASENLNSATEQVQAQHYEAKLYWQNPPAEDMKQITKIIDASSVKELNLKAVELWENLLSCNDGNADLTRRALGGEGSLCSNISKKNEMSVKLAELVGNYREFLFSTPFLDRLNISNIVFGVELILNIHPIISQIAIQQWAYVLNHGAEKQTELSNTLMAAYYKMADNAVLMEFETYKRNPKEFQEYLIPYSERQRVALGLVVNNLAFLGYLAKPSSGNACRTYGMWPELNKNLLYKNMLWNGLHESFSSQLEALHKKVVLNCGAQTPSNWTNGAEYKKHLENLRGLYHKWLEAKLE